MHEGKHDGAGEIKGKEGRRGVGRAAAAKDPSPRVAGREALQHACMMQLSPSS